MLIALGLCCNEAALSEAVEHASRSTTCILVDDKAHIVYLSGLFGSTTGKQYTEARLFDNALSRVRPLSIGTAVCVNSASAPMAKRQQEWWRSEYQYIYPLILETGWSPGRAIILQEPNPQNKGATQSNRAQQVGP